jgi:hypothetical protein
MKDWLLASVMLLGFTSGVHLFVDMFVDFRTFKQIETSCAERGFIQNEKVRIKCEVE